ncbi:putative SMP-30/Gluconolactonase/LRE-like region domain-containing protein [Seiridium cardinale]|uniref:SMP-30/Gluconolactonase/LRE-like region domain-containing protein n=1 Tax=Seiridium cardinale TaxID=138064 RepID=A0ABR2XV73_9PEZI
MATNFSIWGPPGGVSSEHSWQYMLDSETNELRNIATNPPTVNAHGCVFPQGAMYVVTDGGLEETETLLPFMCFNDLDIDPDGNFWLTDSKSAYDLTEFYPPTNPTVYMVNGTTMRPRVVHITTGNANDVDVGVLPDGQHRVYLPDTGVSEFKSVHGMNAPTGYSLGSPTESCRTSGIRVDSRPSFLPSSYDI